MAARMGPQTKSTRFQRVVKHWLSAGLRPTARSLFVRAETGAARGYSTAPRLVLVASKNPVKVNAVQRALQLCFPTLDLTAVGRETPSGVPDQPYGDQQTLEGARNRVAAAASGLVSSAAGLGSAEGASAATHATAPSLAETALVVAIEGGVAPVSHPGVAGTLECFAWVCVMDPQTGAESTARSSSYALPPPLVDLVNRGMELGHADDSLFGRVRSKHGSGTIGKLSDGALDRTEYYVQPTVCALLPYMKPELYGQLYGRLLAGETGSVESGSRRA